MLIFIVRRAGTMVLTMVVVSVLLFLLLEFNVEGVAIKAGQLLPGLDALHRGHSHRVAAVVNQEMWCAHLMPPRVSPRVRGGCSRWLLNWYILYKISNLTRRW